MIFPLGCINQRVFNETELLKYFNEIFRIYPCGINCELTYEARRWSSSVFGFVFRFFHFLYENVCNSKLKN